MTIQENRENGCPVLLQALKQGERNHSVFLSLPSFGSRIWSYCIAHTQRGRERKLLTEQKEKNVGYLLCESS